MHDALILNWLNEHLVAYRCRTSDDRPYEMTYLDGQGIEMIVTGDNIRDCVGRVLQGQGTRSRV